MNLTGILVLKELSHELSVPLSRIFQTSLSCRILPVNWKMANIIAVHKKDNPSIPGNYRPISLTSTVCKILEGIVRDHIVQHMNNSHLFSNKQFGFISGRSTLFSY